MQSQVDIRNAEQALAIVEYGRVASRAFGEVESALSAGFALDERVAILARVMINNERALEIAHTRYRIGSADLRAVNQQQLVIFSARSALVRVEAERRVQRVNCILR